MAQIYIHPTAQKLHLVAALQRRTGLVAMPDGRVVRMIPADEWMAIRLAYRSARRNAVAEHFGRKGSNPPPPSSGRPKPPHNPPPAPGAA